MNFNWKLFQEGGVAVNCKTEEKAKRFLLECQTHNVRSASPIGIAKNEWGNFKENTCYMVVSSLNSYGTLYRLAIIHKDNVPKTKKLFEYPFLSIEDLLKGVYESVRRPTKNEYYLNIAKAVSERSTCLRRHYGAVIVKNDEIISTGYNGSPRGSTNCCDIGFCKREIEGHEHNDGDYSSCESVHAEMNAIISASRNEMIGATLYLYGEEKGKVIDAVPCPICQRMINNAGIVKVIGSKVEE